MSTGRGDVALRILLAAALVVDAVVHWRLAGGYGQATGTSLINEGALFRAEAVVAVLVALLVLLRGGRFGYVAAFLVTGSAVVAVVLYRYVDIPAIGPLPSMYEPVWYAEKTLSAVAEGVGAVLAAVGLLLSRGHPTRPPARRRKGRAPVPHRP